LIKQNENKSSLIESSTSKYVTFELFQAKVLEIEEQLKKLGDVKSGKGKKNKTSYP